MLALEIAMVIFVCLAFFTMGLIIGWNAKKEQPIFDEEPKRPALNLTVILQKRIEQLRNVPTEMKIGIYNPGIYTKEMI